MLSLILSIAFAVSSFVSAGCEYRPAGTQATNYGPDLVAADPNAEPTPEPKPTPEPIVEELGPELIDGKFHVMLLKPSFYCGPCKHWLETVNFELQRKGYKVGFRENVDGYEAYPAFKVAGQSTVYLGSRDAQFFIDLLGPPRKGR